MVARFLRPPILVAALLVLVAIGALASTGGMWASTEQFLVRKFAAVIVALYALLLAGYFLARGRVGPVRDAAWFVAKVSAVVVAVELMLQAAGAIVDFDNTAMDRRFYLSPYRKAPWAEQYFREFAEAKPDFEQFVMWRREPFRGEYVNILPGGFRKTWRPSASSDDTRDTVLVFGGSTVWGSGARDDHTIPSHIAKQLADRGNYDVVNCGESAYHTPQELVYLTTLLRSGTRPRVVIFYDGVNDVYSAWDDGDTETVQHYRRMESRIEAERTIPLLVDAIYNGLQNHSHLFDAYTAVARSLVRSGGAADTFSHHDRPYLDSIALATADSYERSYRQVEALARAYDFTFACFWQPSLYTEATLTDEERSYPELANADLRYLYPRVREILRARDLTQFHDISNVLAGHDSTVYLDHCHLIEAANAAVAGEIVEPMGDAFAPE